MTEKKHATDIFLAAVEAVQPARLMRQALQADEAAISICGQSFAREGFRYLYVIGAGKASAAMAVETEKILGNDIREGIITTKYGHSLATRRIRVVESAHPVPDENGVEAVGKTLDMLRGVTADDIVICLVSGGASALWCDIPDDITLEDIRYLSSLLVRSGASISEINCIRKHVARIKGGQLAAYCNGARMFSLIISDVPGDDMDVIASGPTVPDLSTWNDVRAVLEKYDLPALLPPSVRSHIEKGLDGRIPETPRQGDPLFERTENRIIGSNRIALEAAATKARSLGYQVMLQTSVVTGETGAEAGALVKKALEYRGERPACFLQGGETTLKVTGAGKGGRNQHFALQALCELNKTAGKKWEKITILSGGTDGTDGPTDATGATVDQNTRTIALEKGLVGEDYLQQYDSWHFFLQTGDLLITGPTQTNVMDIMIALVN